KPIRNGMEVEATLGRPQPLTTRATRLQRLDRASASPNTQSATPTRKLVCDRHANTRGRRMRRNAHALQRTLGKRPSTRSARARAWTPRHTRREAHRRDQQTHTNPTPTTATRTLKPLTHTRNPARDRNTQREDRAHHPRDPHPHMDHQENTQTHQRRTRTTTHNPHMGNLLALPRVQSRRLRRPTRTSRRASRLPRNTRPHPRLPHPIHLAHRTHTPTNRATHRQTQKPNPPRDSGPLRTCQGNPYGAAYGGSRLGFLSRTADGPHA